MAADASTSGNTTTIPPFGLLDLPSPHGRVDASPLLWPGGPSLAPGHGGRLLDLTGFGVGSGVVVGVAFGVGSGVGRGVAFGMGRGVASGVARGVGAVVACAGVGVGRTATITPVGDGDGTVDADGPGEADGPIDGPGTPGEGGADAGGAWVGPSSPLGTADPDGPASLGVAAGDGRPATPRSVGGMPKPTASANVARTRFRTPRAMTRRA